ncbi:MAG TPA: YceI family protein [Caulobacteraceae bacterium]|nr:YceI family protein [Caulobacteraceae bacterium]
MLKRLSLAIVASFALTGSVLAQGGPPAQSGTYNLEPIHAMVMFGVSHFGFSDYYGQFPGATGSLTLDAANPAASHLEVSIPVANVWTASDKLTGELKSADWLDAAKYPAMTFKSTRVTVTGATTADVAGDLTIHGVTKPVVLKATFKRGAVFPMNKKYMIGFDATGHVKRSDFGVTKYVNFGLGDDVDLIISAPFEKAS